jgi:hypothetical protein
MPVVINDFEIVVPSAESTPATPPATTTAAAAATGPVWSAELASRLEEQLRLSVERAQRLQAD